MGLSLTRTLAALPPEYPESLLSRIREAHLADARTVVVLDDDPTGTQTVHDTPVLTEWSVESLTRELRAAPPLLFLLTNSRSLPAARAEALATEIGEQLRAAAARSRRAFSVISRGDSTLRGHYPGEVDALAQVLGLARAPHLLIPFFAEGGRLTLADVHYVAEGDQLIPAAETPFARDASFGYAHSNLREWVEEKTHGRIRAAEVRSLGLGLLRGRDLGPISQWLEALPDGGVGIVNAASPRDLEVFVAGLQPVERAGRRFLFRTAASFVQIRTGLPARPLLSERELAPKSAAGGLFVIGSYVPKTTVQLTHLLETAGAALKLVELDVASLLAGEEDVLAATSRRVDAALEAGRAVGLATSRRLVTGADAEASLAIGRRVSEALVEIVRRLSVRPRFLVAKGGITASDVATAGLGVRRAQVRGQILPGVPVWELGEESRFPGLTYVVFPGNVGGPEALTAAWSKLQGHPPDG